MGMERAGLRGRGNVVPLRFERGLREPKTLVLPLHHGTILNCMKAIFSECGAKIESKTLMSKRFAKNLRYASFFSFDIYKLLSKSSTNY